MPSLDVNSLLETMTSAAAESIPAMKDTAITAFKKLADNFVQIEEMRIAGTIDDEQCKILLDMQKKAAETVLTTEEGLSLLAAQNAINSALKAISGTVNTSIGLKIV